MSSSNTVGLPAPRGGVSAWLLAARPKTLPAAAAPVMVGTSVAFASGHLRPWPALGALIGALAIQIGTNFANDVFDYEKGADDEHRLGPTRAVQAGLLSSRQMKLGLLVAFGFAVAAGLYLTTVAGPVIVLIGVLSILSGLAYTAGPFPLAYTGLGDLFVIVFFGFVAVCGTALVQVGEVPGLAWWASAPVGALSTAILVVNNVRDRNTDVRANKRTLVVRWGRAFGVAEYAALLLVAYAVPVVLWLSGRSTAWILLTAITLPLAVRLLRSVMNDEGEVLNATLAGTAKLLLAHSLLMSLGLCS